MTIFHKMNKFVSKRNLFGYKFYLILIIFIAMIYSLYIATIANFHSDWSEFYLLLNGLFSKENLSNYYMPPDSFILQILVYILPFFLLFDISYKSFVIPIFFQTLVNVIALYFLIFKITPRLKNSSHLLHFSLFILTLMGPLMNILNFAMYRKDIPLILLSLFYLCSERLLETLNGKRVLNISFVLSLLFLILQSYGDPFIFYIILVPLIVSGVLFYVLRIKAKVQLFQIIIYTSLIFALSWFLRLITGKYIFHLYNESGSFVSIQNISSNISIFLNDIDVLLPFTGFFGNSIFRFSNMYYILNISVLIIFIISTFYGLKLALKKNNFFIFFLLTLPIFNVLIYVFSSRPGSDPLTERYLIVMAYLFYISIFYILLNLKLKFIRQLLLVYLLLFFHFIFQLKNFSTSLFEQLVNWNNYHKIEANNKLIDLLHNESLEKGFAGYWDASSNTFYTRNLTKIRPILCLNDTVYPFYWFVFDTWYNPEFNLEKTFIYVDKTSSSIHTYTCSIESFRKQFGTEMKAIEFETNKFLYIWDYDISSKIPKINVMENDLIK